MEGKEGEKETTYAALGPVPLGEKTRMAFKGFPHFRNTRSNVHSLSHPLVCNSPPSLQGEWHPWSEAGGQQPPCPGSPAA